MLDPPNIVFPSKDRLQNGQWRPILLRPHPDSPDQFVVGIVAWTATDKACFAADAARRIRCVFPDAAQTILLAQQAAIAAVNEALVKYGPSGLDGMEFGFSGIALGEPRVGEALDASSLARYWLDRTSSLHKKSTQTQPIDDQQESADEMMAVQVNNDRLPVLVFHAVEKRNPDLIDFFSRDIRFKAKRISRPAPQKVIVGFSGNGVVANFATLKPTRSRVMIDHVKRLMWDLSRARDDEVGLLPLERQFQMVVYRRPKDDPELTESQDEQLREMISDLSDQGAKDEIGVETRHTVEGIASYLAQSEQQVSIAR